MKVVFIGCVQFSQSMLEKLIGIKADVVGVITKESSNFNADFVDLSNLAQKENIPVRYTKNVNSKEDVDWIKQLEPDVIFCFGWSNLLKEEVLSIPKIFTVGYHPAKLPQNRGRHPLVWALALGLNETASTFFVMNKNADEGAILSQKDVGIEYEDDANSLMQKITSTALIQIEDVYNSLKSGTIKLVEQDSEKANSWRKRGKEDGKIDFRMSSESIYNLVRALTKPYIGAHICFKDDEIKVWKVEPIMYNENNIEPGKVIDVEGEIFTVKTMNGAVRILEHGFDKIPEKGIYL